METTRQQQIQQQQQQQPLFVVSAVSRARLVEFISICLATHYSMSVWNHRLHMTSMSVLRNHRLHMGLFRCTICIIQQRSSRVIF
mmetsp:Transcript_16796/g.39613  ORF Transcript_16796/g.39613 Transcript_16796/m.39613 type:complete len:85 (+) Transcript_16796:638-892(+)